MCFMDSAKPEKPICNNDRELPLGMGYKSCWMVVEGTSQKAVMDAFLQGRKMKYTYEKGLEKVAKAGTKENKLLVTATYKKQNYVIGTPVSQFFYETEEFLAKCRNFPRVYVYMTHRTSETHGFALVEKGELVRFFKYDENEIKNIGQPLPEEIALGYRLPKTFEDVWNEEENFTEINEDMIIELAIRQVGIDVGAYPYKDVKVGKRFEYAADLAKDPYAGENDVVTEETWNLPAVQRFSAAKTYREKLEVVNDFRDELTHPILDVFGEIIEIYAGYGRLSERIDEMCYILQTSAELEESVMTQEDFFKELSRGNCIFEDKIFEEVVFEDISCKNLTFHKCRFRNVQFMKNQIERLELNDCVFSDSIFTGKWENTSLILHKNYFNSCKIHDLEVLEASRPSEMTDCQFGDCEFSNIKFHGNATVAGGWFADCTGDGIEICNIEVGEEPSHKTSTFKNCSVNGELHA